MIAVVLAAAVVACVLAREFLALGALSPVLPIWAGIEWRDRRRRRNLDRAIEVNAH